MNRGLISASLMAADPFDLPQNINELEKNGIDYLHIDVMDGKFVPNIGLGCDYINSLRLHTDIPLDFHLMVERPDEVIPLLNIRENDQVSVHYESTYQVQRTLDKIKQTGAKTLIAINPATSIWVIEEVLSFIDGINLLFVNPGFVGQPMVRNSMDKAERLFDKIRGIGDTDFIIEVDGNITVERAKLLFAMGANLFVAGTSSIFPNHKLNVENLIEMQKILT